MVWQEEADPRRESGARHLYTETRIEKPHKKQHPSQTTVQPWQKPWKRSLDTNISISQRRPFQIRGASGFLKNQLEKAKLVLNLATYTTGNLDKDLKLTNKTTEVLEGKTWRPMDEKCFYTCGKRVHPLARGGELRTTGWRGGGGGAGSHPRTAPEQGRLPANPPHLLISGYMHLWCSSTVVKMRD